MAMVRKQCLDSPLKHEAGVFAGLAGGVGIPMIHFDDYVELSANVMVVDLLGRSLWHLADAMTLHVFTPNTVIGLGWLIPVVANVESRLPSISSDQPSSSQTRMRAM